MEPGQHDGGDRDPKRRRRRLSDGPCAGDHADHICSLPDDLLIAIISRVGDSRAAVSTSALSRRWRRLDPARWIPAFAISVGDHLPPEYPGTLHRYRSARVNGDDDDDARWEELARRVAACEDRAMEAYVRGLSRFLQSPDRYPAARSLRLEFFLTASSAARKSLAACLDSALRWPNLERLALSAFPRGGGGAAAAEASRQPAHVFPDPEPVRALVAANRSRLATLHVKNCLARSGRGYGLLFPSLTRLTIEVTPGTVKAAFPTAYFGDILMSCRGLVFLRLVSCYLAGAAARRFQFQVDLPPAPRLRELVLEACNFGEVRLGGAPCLERLVVESCGLLSSVTVGNAPRLATLACHSAPPRMHGDSAGSIRFVELRAADGYSCESPEQRLASFFESVPKVQVLKLCCFQDPQWLLVCRTFFPSTFENLKKLLIDLPRVWPLHQIKKLLELLEVATCLEKLHIHFLALPLGTSEEWDTKTPGNNASDDFQHTCLRQIVMEGFERTTEQTALIRLLLSSCRALKTLILIRCSAFLGVKLGRQGGTACPSWLIEENAEIISQLRGGIYTDAEIVLR
ncbi:unnamed protein product [Urochloa decumbens]|uniref:F-box/LRR-repeat protein 15/At3g58940/PEG3-like LRR domain-containing protein n=1 Tax=Urochloa decumbens TaxID=240449 RepID=A0ABC9F3D8_9POAL